MDKLRDYYNKLRNSKSFIPFSIGSSLMLILIVLLIIVTSTSSGNLTSIETTLGNKIYIDENNNFDTEVFGSGSLNNTNYSFDVYPDNIVYLTNEKLSGSKVTNQVLGLRTGVFTINITANLGLKKLKINNKQVAVCKRLSLNNFNFSEYEVILNKKSQIKLDLGNANACTSDIIYKVDLMLIYKDNVTSFSSSDNLRIDFNEFNIFANTQLVHIYTDNTDVHYQTCSWYNVFCHGQNLFTWLIYEAPILKDFWLMFSKIANIFNIVWTLITYLFMPLDIIPPLFNVPMSTLIPALIFVIALIKKLWFGGGD